MAKRVLITSERIGRGDDELGALLTRNFLYSLARQSEKPSAVMLMNGGVRLACEGSPVLEDLRLLAEQGVAIRVCGTCLDHLGLMESLAVGEVGTMADAATAILSEDEVVTVA